jgi:uncharacterized SAM-binding protein YcdF (DUF218 family)
MSVYNRKLFTGSVSFWLFVTASSCSFSSKTTKRLLKEAEQSPYDIVVVPGVPFENNLWSRTMKGRVYWAKHLFDKGITKNIMFSGSAVYSPYYEGKIMALYAEAIGIPKANIFTETKAEHSTENIYYSYKKAKKLGFERIGLASDPFQTKMLRKFTRKKVNPNVGLVPMVVDTLKVIEPSMTDPSIDYQQAFEKDFIPLTKRQGFWKRFRGTMGKNVDTKAYD